MTNTSRAVVDRLALEATLGLSLSSEPLHLHVAKENAVMV